MIQEFKVENNSFSAEFGNNGGTVINVLMKQGGNRFHGSGWWFGQRSGLDANDFFSNAAGLPRPAHRHNQYGGTLNGPIKKEKTFFLFDLERLTDSSPVQIATTVPTPAERKGDFSQTYYADANGNPVPNIIYDPLSGPPGSRTPFTGNIIPASELSSIGAAVVSLYPAPNQPGDPLLQTNNFRTNVLSAVHGYQLDAKVDDQFTANQRFSVRYSHLGNDSTTRASGCPTSRMEIHCSEMSPRLPTASRRGGFRWLRGSSFRMWRCVPALLFVCGLILNAAEPRTSASGISWTHYVRIAGHGLRDDNAAAIVAESERSNVFGIEVDNDVPGRYESLSIPQPSSRPSARLPKRRTTSATKPSSTSPALNASPRMRQILRIHFSRTTAIGFSGNWTEPRRFSAAGPPFGSGVATKMSGCRLSRPNGARYMSLVRQIAAAGIDGVYVDIPYWMTHFTGWEKSWASFDDYTVAAFRRETGLDARHDIRLGDVSDPHFRHWIDFRINAITAFMKEIDSNVKAANPRCVTIAEIYPGIKSQSARLYFPEGVSLPVISAQKVTVTASPFTIAQIADVHRRATRLSGQFRGNTGKAQRAPFHRERRRCKLPGERRFSRADPSVSRNYFRCSRRTGKR